MKKKIVFIPTLIRFSNILNSTSHFKPNTPIAKLIYYPTLLKTIDHDELSHSIPNIIDITPEISYELVIPYDVSDCKANVYVWKTSGDYIDYSQFENATILVYDRFEANILMKVSLFKDGSFVKATYPKIFKPVSHVDSIFSPYRRDDQPEIILGYNTECPIYECHSANSDERIIVYEYSDLIY